MRACLILSHPRPRAPGRVAAPERLGHHALESRGDRGRIEALGLFQSRRHDSTDEREAGARGEPGQLAVAFFVWPIDPQLAVEREQVEHEQPYRLLEPQPLDVAYAPEASHHLLEGERAPGRVDGDHFAVEDGVAVAEARRCLGDLGQALRDLVEAARKDSHAAGRMMDLHARAIDFVLDSETRAENRESVGDRARRLREHRAQRPRMGDAVGGGGREGARRRPSFAIFAVGGTAASPPAPPTFTGAAPALAPASRAATWGGWRRDCASRPTSPSSMCIRRTSSTGRPAIFAIASSIMPSLIPWRISPISTLAAYFASSAVIRANSSRSPSSLRRRALRPSMSAISSNSRLTSVSVSVGSGSSRPQPDQHLDRLAEVVRGGEDVLALILAAAKRGDDFPYRAAAHVAAASPRPARARGRP